MRVLQYRVVKMREDKKFETSPWLNLSIYEYTMTMNKPVKYMNALIKQIRQEQTYLSC